MFHKSHWLGQVPLILGPSSWGAGTIPTYVQPTPFPHFWGEWGVREGESGKVGPFNTPDEAFRAAVEAAMEHGADELPRDGFAQVVDSRDQAVGPTT